MEALAKALPQLSGLQHLSLSSNEICTLPVELGQLSGLQHLNLKSNEICTLPVELGQLACLRTLDMSRNKIHTLPDAVCRGLAQLVHAYASLQPVQFFVSH